MRTKYVVNGPPPEDAVKPPPPPDPPPLMRCPQFCNDGWHNVLIGFYEGEPYYMRQICSLCKGTGFYKPPSLEEMKEIFK